PQGPFVKFYCINTFIWYKWKHDEQNVATGGGDGVNNGERGEGAGVRRSDRPRPDEQNRAAARGRARGVERKAAGRPGVRGDFGVGQQRAGGAERAGAPIRRAAHHGDEPEPLAAGRLRRVAGASAHDRSGRGPGGWVRGPGRRGGGADQRASGGGAERPAVRGDAEIQRDGGRARENGGVAAIAHG